MRKIAVKSDWSIWFNSAVADARNQLTEKRSKLSFSERKYIRRQTSARSKVSSPIQPDYITIFLQECSYR